MSKSFGLNNKYPLSRSQWRVELSGIPIASANYGRSIYYFTSFSGIDDNAESIKYADPTSNRIFHLTGPREANEVTLKAPFVPDIHSGLINWWKKASCHDVSLTVTAIRCDDAYDEGSIGSSNLVGSGEDDTSWPNPASTTLIGGNSQQTNFTIMIIDAKCSGIKFGDVDKTASEVSELEIKFAIDTYLVDN